tara:strand:+ start:379 stop:525 length:147 start_codon:yes stop_codon:yes gene_type:complete
LAVDRLSSDLRTSLPWEYRNGNTSIADELAAADGAVWRNRKMVSFETA